MNNLTGRTGRGTYGQQQANNFVPIYGNFTPEAKIYPQEVFTNLTAQQNKSISDLKASQGWINPTTPPAGFRFAHAVFPRADGNRKQTHLVTSVNPFFCYLILSSYLTHLSKAF